MLIINADDWGRSVEATNAGLTCLERKRITSASALVFMKDSGRGAESALAAGLGTGLHLNLDMPFDGPGVPFRLRQSHSRIQRYLGRGKWPEFVYNPLLRKDFDYVFKAQYEEFFRLFGKGPAQIDGHRHRHLCANMLIDRILPSGACVRRNFTFEPGEKSVMNRAYRSAVDKWLASHYRCTDAFFSIEPLADSLRLARIVSLAHASHVEVMVHPERHEQTRYLLGDEFGNLIASVPAGSYLALSRAKNGNMAGNKE